MSQVESCGTHTLRCLAPQNVLESPLRKWVEGSKTGQRWKSSWEAAPRTGSADSAGSSRAKRAHLHHLLSTWPHSFPGCGPPREGHDLGRAHSVGEPISKGTDSSRLSDDCTRSSWGYSPSSRKELGAASLCVHHMPPLEVCNLPPRKDTVLTWLRVHPHPVWLRLNLII